MKGQPRGAAKAKRTKKLLEDCFVLITSLVLTEPFTTENQQKKFPGLIKRLKAELSGDSRE